MKKKSILISLGGIVLIVVALVILFVEKNIDNDKNELKEENSNEITTMLKKQHEYKDLKIENLSIDCNESNCEISFEFVNDSEEDLSNYTIWLCFSDENDIYLGGQDVTIDRLEKNGTKTITVNSEKDLSTAYDYFFYEDPAEGVSYDG